jgi:hypothetical protein
MVEKAVKVLRILRMMGCWVLGFNNQKRKVSRDYFPATFRYSMIKFEL